MVYWDLWRDVPVRFVTADRTKVPEHWLAFGQRRSSVARTSRLAMNPANAMLNYLYAILEAEARLACLAVGLDPGLGVLHADLKARDSLALDVMEAVRPNVDEWVLGLLESHTFRAKDFHETRQGVCRVLPPLAHELASTGLTWAKLLGPVVERVGRDLANGPSSRVDRLPTPLTGSHRYARRSAATERRLPTPHPILVRPTYERCGGTVPHRKRRFCAVCLPARIAETSCGVRRGGSAAPR